MDNITNIVNTLIHQDRRFLLLYNTKYRDYTFPGGKQDVEDDSLETTLRREILEESGMFTCSLGKIGEYPFQTNERGFVRHVYEAVITKGEPAIMEDDVFGEIKWATLEESLELPLAPRIRDALIDYQNRLNPIKGILEYSPDISLEEAEKGFKAVEQRFAAFYWRHFFHYSGLSSDEKIGEEPLMEAGLYFDALNHLTMANSVQEQRFQSGGYEGTLHSQIILLTMKISEFLSMFEDTGIRAYKASGETFN